MSNRAVASEAEQDAGSREPGSPGLGRLWYTPAAGELDQVRTYLAEIEASVSLLPELTPDVDSLDVGYDPSWNEAVQ